MNIYIKKAIAAILAALMLGSILFQLIGGMSASAADDASNVIVTRGGSAVSYIERGNTVTIQFDIYLKGVAPAPELTATSAAKKIYTTYDFTVNTAVWRRSSATASALKAEFLSYNSKDDLFLTQVTVTNLEYRSANKSGQLSISGPDGSDTISLAMSGVTVDIPSFYIYLDYSLFERASASGGGGESDGGEEEYSSDIIVESVVAVDGKGGVISEITKDTPPFSVEIVYTDRGLWDVESDEFSNETMYAYLTDAGPFVPNSTAKGSLRRVSAVSGAPPRFRATFDNVTFTGGAKNFGEFEFRVHYDVYGFDVKGESKARLYNVVSEDEDEKNITPPTPYIIISQYDLGKEQIEAGSTFTLALNFGNTSKELAVENIRMVINPVTTGTTEASFLSIASATNTYYYEQLGADGSLSQSIDILVKGTATVGSQAVSVEFFYEYVLEKERKLGNTATTIYVPITQIDRFSVDPITDYSAYMMAGDEGYVSVSFVNRGKSATYNISGYLLDAEGNQGQTEHFGNLDAGEHGTLDFIISPSDPGDYNGAVVILYEDENGDRKEVSSDFNTFVEQRYFPPPEIEDPGFTGDVPQDSGAPWWRYALFILGGLSISAPLALYLAKRIKAKGSEDFDEDF